MCHSEGEHIKRSILRMQCCYVCDSLVLLLLLVETISENASVVYQATIVARRKLVYIYRLNFKHCKYLFGQ